MGKPERAIPVSTHTVYATAESSHAWRKRAARERPRKARKTACTVGDVVRIIE